MNFVSAWGHPDHGCEDHSDKMKNFNMSNKANPCEGDEYKYYNAMHMPYRWEVKRVDWEWFSCTHTKKCIHANNRCDFHPHPDCIYQTENGLMVSEDEEDCPSRNFFYHLNISYFNIKFTFQTNTEGHFD